MATGPGFERTPSERADVCIVGAGPAGTVVATRLADRILAIADAQYWRSRFLADDGDAGDARVVMARKPIGARAAICRFGLSSGFYRPEALRVSQVHDLVIEVLIPEFVGVCRQRIRRGYQQYVESLRRGFLDG